MASHRIRVKLELSKIDQRQEVDALEANLKNLPTVEIHALGLSEVEISYNQHEVDDQALTQAVESAGGAIREINRVE